MVDPRTHVKHMSVEQLKKLLEEVPDDLRANSSNGNLRIFQVDEEGQPAGLMAIVDFRTERVDWLQ